jgi:hypothetical protein
MTWLKLSDDFDDDCARTDLSDAAFRTHVQGLLYAMRRETGGWLDDRSVRRFPDTKDPEAAIAELVASGFWARGDGGYQVIHQMEWQPTPEDLAARREADAARQAKARTKRASEARKKASVDQQSRRDSERDSRRDDTRDYGPGRDGSGQVGQETNPALDEKDEPESWGPLPSSSGRFRPCSICTSTTGDCRCFDEMESA